MEVMMTRSAVHMLCLTLLMTLGAGVQANETERLGMMLKIVGNSDNPAVQANILKGVVDGLAGRRDVPAPDNWKDVKATLGSSSDANVKKLAQELGQIFGDKGASQAALGILRDTNADVAARRKALKSLVAQQDTALLPELEKLLDQPLKIDAIRAYSAFEHKPAPAILLRQYADFDPATRQAVIETLASRKTYARALVRALKSEKVKKTEIPAYVARTMKSLMGEQFTAVYGEVQEVSANKSKLIATYKRKLSDPAFAKADASRGRVMFAATCGACHKMYGAGGEIGPDLTGSNRADADYILLNILDPSFDVPEGYRMVTVTTKGGQVLVGNIAEEDDQKIVVKMVGQKTVVAKADITKRQVSKISMMPEGLLSNLTDQQYFDLIAYLQTEKQVALPK
jgi:putative heme-binding domain-containing protein